MWWVKEVTRRPGPVPRKKKNKTMERNYIWVLKNDEHVFIKACATREMAIEKMEAWRKNCENMGVFKSVSKLSTVYYDYISFLVTDRNGKEREMTATKTILF